MAAPPPIPQLAPNDPLLALAERAEERARMDDAADARDAALDAQQQGGRPPPPAKAPLYTKKGALDRRSIKSPRNAAIANAHNRKVAKQKRIEEAKRLLAEAGQAVAPDPPLAALAPPPPPQRARAPPQRGPRAPFRPPAKKPRVAPSEDEEEIDLEAPSAGEDYDDDEIPLEGEEDEFSEDEGVEKFVLKPKKKKKNKKQRGRGGPSDNALLQTILNLDEKLEKMMRKKKEKKKEKKKKKGKKKIGPWPPQRPLAAHALIRKLGDAAAVNF